MTTLTVRSKADAWRAIKILSGPRATEISKIEFHGYPTVTVDASAPIEEMSGAKAIIAMQTAVNRQFCLLKYGHRDLRHFPAVDRAKAKVDVSRANGGRSITFDLSGAANAAARTVQEWGAHGPPAVQAMENLFASEPNKFGKDESWARTTRELGHRVLDRLGRGGVLAIGLLAVVMVTLTHADPHVAHEVLAYVSERQDATADQQYRIAMRDKTTVVDHTGAHAKLSPKTVKNVEEEIDAQRTRARYLISENIEQPLLKFVAAESERARPALLDMAPEWGTITINGSQLSSDMAKAAAKTLRKQARAMSIDENGWAAKVHPATKAIRS